MDGPMIISIPVGSVGTANKELFKVPASHGGITLIRAYLVAGAASTCVASLNNHGTTAGTTIVSNIGTLPVASSTLVANVPAEMTISTAYQSKDTWVAFRSVTGITDAAAFVVIEYKYGK